MLAGDCLALTVLNVAGNALGQHAEGAGLTTLLLAAAQPWWHFDAAVFLSLVVTKSYPGWSRSHRRSEVLRAALLASLLTFWGALPMRGFTPALLGIAELSVVTGAMLLAGRSCMRWMLRAAWQGMGRAPTAVVVGTIEDFRSAAALASAEEDYRVVGYIARSGEQGVDALGGIDELGALIGEHRIDTVLIGDAVPEEELHWIMDVSQVAGCELLYPASAVEIGGKRAKLVTRCGQSYFELGAPVLHAQQLLLKRLLDVVGAVSGLVLLSPLFLIISAIVKLDSRGTVLFSQDRVGLGGRRFRMLKFRTMRSGADAEKGALSHLNCTGDARLFKIPNDPRVTRVGAMLRRWSLDELPQLWNVLRGDMSLVGPRPFFESDLADYEAHHFRRLGAKPGITGLWQVSGRSEVVDFEEVVRYDREYIERWSVRLDLWILLRTVPVMLRRTGAY